MLLENTIIEKLEHSIKTSDMSYSMFKKEKKNPIYQFEDMDKVWDYHKEYCEPDFNYCLFQLYCFYDYTIEDVFEMVHDISLKTHKSDLSNLVYSDFVEYFRLNHFHERKLSYIRSSDEYKNKVNLKNNIKSDNIIHISDDYNSLSL